MQKSSGLVKDERTKLPLDSVCVYNANNSSDYGYTDTKGFFNLQSISGGPCGCPPMTVLFKKVGYDSTIVKIKNDGNKNIYLVK